MPPTTVLLVRHGETAYNVEGRLQGQSDSELTALGQLQAEQLGARLANWAITACYSRLVGHFHAISLTRDNQSIH